MSLTSRPPIVTLLLISANILVAFLVVVRLDYVSAYGFRASDPSLFTAITSLFVHANVFHLMGNMVFLAAVGASVEIATGTVRFLLVYLISGLAGVAIFWVATRNVADAPALVGASGAIAGCAGYYSLRYTKLRVPLAPKRSASVAAITGLWVVLQIAGALINVGQPLQAAGFFAHLGGAVAGLILGLVMRAPDLGGLRLGHSVLDSLNDAHGESQVAHIRAHLVQHPDDLLMQIRLAEELERLGDRSQELEVLQKLAFRLEGARRRDAIARLCALDGLKTMPSVRRRQLADALEPDQAELVLQSILSGNQEDPQRAEAMLDFATLLQESEPTRAKAVLDQMESEFPLHGVTELARTRGWLK